MTERHPDLFKVLIGEIGESGKLMLFLAKLWAYCPSPSFSSQSATCCMQCLGLSGLCARIGEFTRQTA